jgi:hypothetical protein
MENHFSRMKSGKNASPKHCSFRNSVICAATWSVVNTNATPSEKEGFLFFISFSLLLSLSHTLSSTFLSALHFFLFSASLSRLLLLLFFCFSLLHVELVRHRMPHLRFLYSEPRIAEDHLTVVTHKSPEITSTKIAGSHP